MRGALRQLVTWVKATFDPLITRLIEVGLVQSAVVLAAQTFMALFPLLIAVIAVTPKSIGGSIADSMRDRLGLAGGTDASVHQLVETHDQLRGAVTVVGVLVVLASATSFTRALQRTYQAAWQLPKLGLRGSLRGLVWLVGMLAYIALAAGAVKLTAVAGPAASPLRWTFTAVTTVLVWWWTPFFLLGGRVRARALLPGALCTGVALLVLSAFSTVYLPRVIGSQERRYGAIGVVFAIESWLVVLAGAVVAAAVLGAVGAQYPGPVGRLARGSHDPDSWRRSPRPLRRRVSRDPAGADQPR
jgi:membrane protein